MHSHTHTHARAKARIHAHTHIPGHNRAPPSAIPIRDGHLQRPLLFIVHRVSAMPKRARGRGGPCAQPPSRHCQLPTQRKPRQHTLVLCRVRLVSAVGRRYGPSVAQRVCRLRDGLGRGGGIADRAVGTAFGGGCPWRQPNLHVVVVAAPKAQCTWRPRPRRRGQAGGELAQLKKTSRNPLTRNLRGSRCAARASRHFCGEYIRNVQNC